MKKISKQDKYFLEMFDSEHRYRTAKVGKDGDSPFVTPVLFSILDTLKLCGYGLFFFGGAILTALLL